MPRVPRVSGACSDSTSDCASSSGRLRARSMPSANSVPFGRYGSKNITRKPNALARSATAVPIRPRPTIAESLHAGAADQRRVDDPPRGIRLALRLVMQQQAAPQRQRQGDGVVGHLRRAVIGHVADDDIALGQGRAVQPVIAYAHAHHRAQAGETRQILAPQPVAEDHQPLGRRAILIRQRRDARRAGSQDARRGAEHLALHTVIGIHGFGIEDGAHEQRGYQSMNGAESLVRTLLAGGIDTCFANPGTSEMHFVAALDRIPGMRCVLCLFEGVATAAADGYARMTDRPAATLLHCGPGLANGLANLHNARRAGVPLLNCVGDQATYHRPLDAPLTADTEGFARGVSAWVRTAGSAEQVGADAAAAIQAARSGNGQIATLILPSDTCWNPDGVPVAPLPPPLAAPVAPHLIEQTARLLRSEAGVLLVIGGRGLRAGALADAHRIAAATGARLIAPMSNARIERGRGRPGIERVPYPVDDALARLGGTRHAVLVGARAPVGFFAYPDKPGSHLPQDAVVHVLARPEQDVAGALAALADCLGAPKLPPVTEQAAPPPARGTPSGEALGQSLAALLPDCAIVVDESVSVGRPLFAATACAAPHDWLQLTGGAIGAGLPLATGAAIAAPGRRVVSLEADGSAMYTLQALWTQARERLDVTTIILSNRRYAILLAELAGVGAGEEGGNPGRTALDMMELNRPDLDWVRLAGGMGVEAAQATSMERFADLFSSAQARSGPFLIELVLDR